MTAQKMLMGVRRRAIDAIPPATKTQLINARLDRFRRRQGASACFAPRMQLHLLPDGDIRTCCRNDQALGNITTQRLPEIWASSQRQQMIGDLGQGTFRGGCSDCGHEVSNEGRHGSYPEVFDLWGARLGRIPAPAGWPNRMEFNLSNTCNLQCIQCSGELSSSIRLHREKRPPLPAVYDEQFFDDLAPFVPHLGMANFAGGEPFLGAENFRVWALIAELNPDLDVTVCTNVTQWNHKVEHVLEQLKMNIIFSLDGVTRETYERIRGGADWDRVLANMDRFVAYAQDRGTQVAINHCLMPQNFAEFGELLCFAEERRIRVNVSVVRTPESASLYHLPDDELRAALAVMTAQEPDILARTRLNRPTWVREVGRLRSWAATPRSARIPARSGDGEVAVAIGPVAPAPR